MKSLKNIMNHSLTALVNQCLQLDPVVLEALKTIQGRVLKLNMAPFSWLILFHPTAIEVLNPYEVEVDASLTLPLTEFIKWVTQSKESLVMPGLDIEGDIELVQKVYGIFQQLDIDWEEWIAHAVGDIPAHHLGNAVRSARRWGFQKRRAIGLNVSETLQFEANLIVSSKELHDFQAEITTLRNDVDRLEARFRILEEQV